MECSAVTQPRPELRSQPGTPCSMVALVRTRVFPNETSTEPSAVWTKPGVSESARSWAGVLPPGRKNGTEACIGELYESRARRQFGRGTSSRLGIAESLGSQQEYDHKALKANDVVPCLVRCQFQIGTQS